MSTATWLELGAWFLPPSICEPAMGYGDYTLDYFLSQFDLSIVQSPLFEHLQPVEPSEWLRDTLRKGRAIAFFSEKSRSEFIVAPVLLSCQEMANDQCCVYSGVRLDVDAEKGLKGECDFIIAKSPPTPALQAPLLIVVEAKKNDIEEGLGQCAAQMIAARFFNERHKIELDQIYGCVTTGESWQFLRLRQRELLVQLGSLLHLSNHHDSWDSDVSIKRKNLNWSPHFGALGVRTSRCKVRDSNAERRSAEPRFPPSSSFLFHAQDCYPKLRESAIESPG